MARKKKTEEIVEEKVEGYVWKDGDNLQNVAKKLTGHSYMYYKLLEFNEITAQELKPGTVLKWR